jgi:hypothetical protein
MVLLPMQFSLFDMNFNTWQCCWLYSGSPCRLQNKYFTFWMMIMHHNSPNGHPARQMYLVPTYCWFFFPWWLSLCWQRCCLRPHSRVPPWLSGSCRVPKSAALTTGTATTFAPSASVTSFSPSMSPGHSLGPKSINRWDIPSPHVRRLGVEPRSYRQQSFTSCQASSCWTTILQTAKIEWNHNRFSFHWVSLVWTSLLLFTLTKNLLFLVPSFAQPSVLT